MIRAQKVELVGELTAKLKDAQSVVLTDFKGMTVGEFEALRSRLRGDSVQMQVIKNRLLKRALADAGFDPLDDLLEGNTAVVMGMDDVAAPAKLVSKFAKDNEKLKIKGGLLEGRRLDLAGIKSLASLPSRHELLSILARDLKQPATKVAMGMQAGLLKVAHAMQALARKKEAAGESA